MSSPTIIAEISAAPADAAYNFRVAVIVEPSPDPTTHLSTHPTLFIIGDLAQDHIAAISVGGPVVHLSKNNPTSTFGLVEQALDMMSGHGANSMLIVAQPDTLTNWYKMKPKFIAIMRQNPFPCAIISSDADCDGRRLAELAIISGGLYLHKDIDAAICEIAGLKDVLYSRPKYTISAHPGARIRCNHAVTVVQDKVLSCSRRVLVFNVSLRSVDMITQPVFTISMHGSVSGTPNTTPNTTFSICRGAELVSCDEFCNIADMLSAQHMIAKMIRAAERGCDRVPDYTAIYGEYNIHVVNTATALIDFPHKRNVAYDIYSRLSNGTVLKQK